MLSISRADNEGTVGGGGGTSVAGEGAPGAPGAPGALASRRTDDAAPLLPDLLFRFLIKFMICDCLAWLGVLGVLDDGVGGGGEEEEGGGAPVVEVGSGGVSWGTPEPLTPDVGELDRRRKPNTGVMGAGASFFFFFFFFLFLLGCLLPV